MNNKLKLWVIIPVCAIVLLLGGTYAWYVWQTSSDEETIIATDVGYAKVYFTGGAELNGNLKPVSDKSKGSVKTITVRADKQFIEDITFNLYLDINSIDAGLKHESFKFELYKGDTLVKTGNFSDAYLNSALSNCETNTGKRHITLASDIVTTEESIYTLYTWIDGNMNNPLSMESQNFDFTLHASGMHAINGSSGDKDGGNEEESNPLVHNGIIPEGGIYIRGAVINQETERWDITINNHDLTNATIYNAGESFPGEPQKGDIYRYGDFEYIYGYYATDVDVANMIAEGVSYNSNNILSSGLMLTNENYDEPVADFIFGREGSYVNVFWNSAEGVYDDTEGWGVAIFNYDFERYIYGDILCQINGGNVINMSGTFADTVNFRGITIPETVKYMDYMLFASWFNTDFKIVIDSKNIISANDNISPIMLIILNCPLSM